MSIWQLLGLVFVAGGIGGVINSLLTDKGFVLPHTVPKGDGTSILVPGFLGNILIGSVAAAVSWLLYGPLSQASVTSTATPAMDLAILGGAVLVGMSGSGWLHNAIDKNVLRAAASQAAEAQPDPDVAKQMLQAPTAEVLKLARQLNAASAPTTEQSAQPQPAATTPVTPPPTTTNVTN